MGWVWLLFGGEFVCVCGGVGVFTCFEVFHLFFLFLSPSHLDWGVFLVWIWAFVMNREMPLYALQKGSVFMSEKTSGMLAHPNTSGTLADGLRKARAVYEASVIFS